ncbi:MAG TPA: hypothetical protein VGL25_10915 [Casimicrobiaceae bacterium]|jgi:hypothetical protein
MRSAFRWIAVLLLQGMVLFGAAAQTTFDQSQRSIDQGHWMPIADFEPAASDAPREIGPIAQGFSTSRSVGDNVKASAGDPANATLSAIKALHEEVKSLETRIAAQDARIATLERTLENYTARNR